MNRSRKNPTKGKDRGKAEQGYRCSLADGVLYTWYESIPIGALILLNSSTAGNSMPEVCGQQHVKKTFPFEEEKRKIYCVLLRATLKEGELVSSWHYWSLRALCLGYAKSFVFCVSWLQSMGNNIKTGITVLTYEVGFWLLPEVAQFLLA